MSACASSPPQAPAPSAAPAGASPTAVAPATTGAAASAAGAPVKDYSGWQTVHMKDGTVKYCRDETIVGTHLSKYYCGTADDMKVLEDRRRADQDALRRNGGTGGQ
jgi:hypothetical protein